MLFRRMSRRPRPVRMARVQLTKKQKFGAKLILCSIVILVLGSILSGNMRPIVTQLSIAKARDIVTLSVNEAVNEKMLDGSLSYDQLVSLVKDETGNITALETDVVKVNRLQAEIISQVIDRVSQMGAADLSIPIGSVIGGNLLSGRGPGIPVRIMAPATSSASFSNEFASAGINQTIHQVYLNVTVDIKILVPGYTTETQVVTEVLVAETVIVGDVPNSYINLN